MINPGIYISLSQAFTRVSAFVEQIPHLPPIVTCQRAVEVFCKVIDIFLGICMITQAYDVVVYC